MKTFVKNTILTSIFFGASLLLSWNFFGKAKQKKEDPILFISLYQQQTFLYDPEESYITYPSQQGDHYVSEENAFAGIPPKDVMAQKIPGNNHQILIIAVYSKQSYSGMHFTLLHGGMKILFRDDGQENDKTAGDGYFTATISTNVVEFRRDALKRNDFLTNNKDRQFFFDDRVLNIGFTPETMRLYDDLKFQNNLPVSIANLTDAAIINPLTIINNCLMITNPSVVEDEIRTWNYCTQSGNPDGAWTFKMLMKQLASVQPDLPATDAQISTFVLTWLKQWSTTRIINGDTCFARVKMNALISNWRTKSNADGLNIGQLDMRFAPFKLTAIINRFDLRNGTDSNAAGESRFVFCLIDNDCTKAEQFNVIFEYGNNIANTCTDIHAWAQRWVDLKDHTIGSPGYNTALQNITDQFISCGSNPLKPNQSSLDHVRTNEIALSGLPLLWELREFIIDSLSNQLVESTLTKEPAHRYNEQVNNPDVVRFVQYINESKLAINSKTYTVPLIFRDSSFLGASSIITIKAVGEPPNVFHWNGADSASGKSVFIGNNNTRFIFSQNTCSGCHAGETQTNFTHIDPAFYGSQATLSGFLSGKAGQGGAVDFDNDSLNNIMVVKDAANRPTANPQLRKFNDLRRRNQDLQNFINTACSSPFAIKDALMFKPVTGVH